MAVRPIMGKQPHRASQGTLAERESSIQMNPYESHELGSLAMQRPLPPSASEQTTLMGLTDTSGTFMTGAKKDLMKVTIDMGEAASAGAGRELHGAEAELA